jgi:single-stranded-DNA-specific exonuclease
MVEQNWIIRTKRADFYALADKFHIDPVVARILINRGLEESQFEGFLHPSLDTLHDPFLMEDMNQAVRIIIHDMEEGHKIRIVSDYDVDGIMSNVILYKGLRRLGVAVDYVVPHRVKDGYGINEEMIEKAAEDGIHTILTCDNGIAATEALAKAKELGMTVIVTDHHQVPYEIVDGEKQYILPPADAILNPKKESCNYPFDDLCGAGVAYKLVEALYEKRDIPKEEMKAFLEFAAMATVCDVVSLVDENRTFVVNGLEMMNHTRNKGLRALISANELSDEKLTAYHIGFRLGPCLNATGRLESAGESIRLLLEEDTEQALIQAASIKNINDERKSLTLQGVEMAQEYLANSAEMKVFVIYLPDCHESLAGIIAGRIREEYHHPVFVLVNSEEEGILKGSGRSIEDYHMYEALRGCDDLLTKYGGHAMAAGLSMKAENLETFTQRINEQCELEGTAFIPKVYIDVPMPISYVTEELVEELENLAPFGKGNEKPVFAQKDVNLLSAKIMGKERNVIKLTMETSDGAIGEGIYFNPQEMSENLISWFGQEEYDKLLHGWLNNIVLNVVYYPSVNEFNGNRTIQFKIKRYSMAAVREVL